MSKIYVIYHRADFDGIFSREIAKRFFGDRAEYIGWDYKDPLPAIDLGDTSLCLYMIDISIDEFMGHPGLVWIDHHKTQIEKYSPHIDGFRLDGVAACRLAWQWFYHRESIDTTTVEQYRGRQVEEPHAVTLAGEYDIWDKRDPDVDLFQAGLQGGEVNFQRLLNGSSFDVIEILERGRPLQYARAASDKWTIDNLAFTLPWEGRTFLAVNSTRSSSDLFKAGLKPEHDACLSFVWNGTKRKWKVSLRGAPGHAGADLSGIAAKHGGGGHKQACGFECETLPFALGAKLQLPWNEETQWILGRPCFAVAGIAGVLRRGGQEIRTKAEDEQAAALYFMLRFHAEHGDGWREAAEAELKRINAQFPVEPQA
jgi:hypothetical protein